LSTHFEVINTYKIVLIITIKYRHGNGLFKKLFKKAKTFLTKTLPAAVSKGLNGDGKLISTFAPIMNKIAGAL
jgi:hypothetical protein